MAKGFFSRGFLGRHRDPAEAGRLPPGQYLTNGFSVLSAGPTPYTPKERWDFRVMGAVETPRTRSLMLDVPNWPGHTAGQHIDVRLTAEDGYQVQRSYSIASPPETRQLTMRVHGLLGENLVTERRDRHSLEQLCEHDHLPTEICP